MPSAIIKCPFPFPDIEATANVEIYQEIDTEDQEPQETLIYAGKAIHDEKAKMTYSKDSKLIALSGLLIIKGDVQTVNSTTAFQGYAKISDETKQIYAVRKPKLLGTIFSTEFDLI